MFSLMFETSASDQHRTPEIRLLSPGSGDLVGQLRLGTGIEVRIDLTRPDRWRSVSVVSWADADPDMLVAVLGDRGFQGSSRLRNELQTVHFRTADETVELHPGDEWLRVALADALDRWLQLPLDQALIDAERGVARGRAAQTLPTGPARDRLVGEALAMARLAAKGLATYLAGLAEASVPPPRPLLDRLEGLVQGYAELVSEVIDGPDPELDDVARAWAGLRAAVRAADQSTAIRVDQSDTVEIAVVPDEHSPRASRVDLRQLPARVVDLSPFAGEIRMESARLGEEPAIRVTVAAYGVQPPSPTDADRLLVRLVDKGSAEVHGTAMLTLRRENGAAAATYTGTVVSGGAALEDLRADVYKPESEVPPATADTDADLIRVRRAAHVLGEWRRTMARHLLVPDEAGLRRRLTRLIDSVRPAMAHADQPLFNAGPSINQLARLVENPAASINEEWARTTVGVGDFLVAELAAVHTSIQ